MAVEKRQFSIVAILTDDAASDAAAAKIASPAIGDGSAGPEAAAAAHRSQGHPSGSGRGRLAQMSERANALVESVIRGLAKSDVVTQ